MNMKKLHLSLAVSAALLGTSAQADVRVNGFANLIGGITSSDKELYGYDDRASFSEETLFAIQVIGDVNEKITATGQIIARGNNDYEPTFEWAYLTFNATDELSVSAGRLRLPLFNYSSSLDVGYSFHWIAPPRSIYNVPFNNLEGIQIDYANFSGDWEYNLSASFGTFEGEVSQTPITGENVFLVSAEATYDIFKLRVVHGATKIDFPLNQSRNERFLSAEEVFNFVEAANLTELGNRLRLEDDTGTFLGISAQIDNFNWFVAGEYTEVITKESFSSDDISFYLTAGLRFGKWTPSVTYEHAEGKVSTQFDDDVTQVASISPQLAGGIRDVLNGVADEVEVVSATLRYDYDTNIALKFDVTRQSDELNDEDVTLIRFGANYVF